MTPQKGPAQRRFRFELAAHPGSVAQARHLAHARLTGWSVCPDTCDNAALVVSELVTNAIVHTASRLVVCELHDHDDTVRIAVCDEGCAPGDPQPSPQRPDEEHGRGLFLVDALCQAWGAQEHGPGLLVWAELARRPDADHVAAEPRNDLGWGARPKPGQPDDSRDDDPAEARHRTPEQAGHRTPDRSVNRPTDQAMGQHGSGPPKSPGSHEGSRGPDRSLLRTPDAPLHRAHEQNRPAEPGPHRHAAPEQHRYRTTDPLLRRSPEQHHAGERP
ncbi:MULTISPECIES: ATP-binding protein [Streptomyces]|uniref:ATP-binding protein n=1 Tax=Streptomyces TaxID=1883 RepID=UPI000A559E23